MNQILWQIPSNMENQKRVAQQMTYFFLNLNYSFENLKYAQNLRQGTLKGEIHQLLAAQPQKCEEYDIILQYIYYLYRSMFQTSNLSQLPQELLQNISTFLRIEDIDRFSGVCKFIHHSIYVPVIHKTNQKIIKDKAFADVLYHDEKVVPDRLYHGVPYELKIIKFIFQTKDQGWVEDSKSGSWIEAQFLDSKGTKINLNQSDGENPEFRHSLVWNYEARDYQIKTAAYGNIEVLRNTAKLQIYLRSSGNKWLISCKSVIIKFYYGRTGFKITEKQTQEHLRIKHKKSIILY